MNLKQITSTRYLERKKGYLIRKFICKLCSPYINERAYVKTWKEKTLWVQNVHEIALRDYRAMNVIKENGIAIVQCTTNLLAKQILRTVWLQNCTKAQTKLHITIVPLPIDLSCDKYKLLAFSLIAMSIWKQT